MWQAYQVCGGEVMYCRYCGKTLTTADNLDRCYPSCPESLERKTELMITLQSDDYVTLVKDRNQLKYENERLRDVYPRAFKLMDKGKYFIVISFDEPYFMKAYSLIRDQEIKIGRWNAEDEATYQYYAEYTQKRK